MNRAELVKTLELVQPALATNNMVPIFQCFTFNNGTVSAYDDAIAIIGPTECEEVCGIHGKTLLGLLSNSRAEEVTLSLDKTTATLKMGKSTSKLPYDPRENYIFEEPEPVRWPYKLDLSASFFEALELCLETVSKDTTQDALRGVTIENGEMYSCDGDAVTRIELSAGVETRILLPTAFCDAITKLWSALTMTHGQLRFDNEWVYADFQDWSVYGRLLEIKDPIDFENAIKQSIKKKIPTQLIPDGFDDALARAMVMTETQSQKTTVTLEKNKMRLFTETHMGEISDTLLFAGNREAEVSVNASHLQRAIKHCDKVAFHENGTLFEKENVMIFVSNM